MNERKLKCCITIFMSNSSGLLAGSKVKLMDSDFITPKYLLIKRSKKHISKSIGVSSANLHVFLIPIYMINSNISILSMIHFHCLFCFNDSFFL